MIIDQEVFDPEAGGDEPNAGVMIPGEAPVDVDAGDTPGDDAANTEMEARARDMGWVPEDEWHGDPKAWRPADEFVRRGEEVLPIVQAQARRLEKQLKDTKRQYEDQFARLSAVTKTALQRHRDMIVNDYEAAKRVAVESADVEQYQQLEEGKLRALEEFDRSNSDAEKAKPAAPQYSAEDQALAQLWIVSNPWFKADRAMRAVAEAEHVRLLRENPELSVADNLKQVRSLVEKEFPHKLRNGRGSPAVEGGQRTARATTKGVASLPREAREAGEEFVREGLFKDLNEFAADYWKQPGVKA